MSVTLIAGVGITVVAVCAVFASIFLHRVSPAAQTEGAAGATVPRRGRTTRAPRPPSYDVEIRWWVRLRSAGVLLALTVGLGALLATAIGSLVFIVSLSLG